MTRLLIYEGAWRRLKDRFAGLAVTPLLATDSGELRLDGKVVDPDDAQPDAAWMNQDLFSAPGASRAAWIALLKARSLKWAQSAAAGFEHPVFGELVKKGVQLTTSHGQAVGMAEYVLWGVLDHFQRGPDRRAAQGESAWLRHPYREVMGTTWLVIGFGAIGQGVGRRARAFGARVIGVRRDQAAHADADEIAPSERIAELLPSADVVVLCVPLQPATKGMVDAGFLSAMKARSVLVNVGRGGLVDETALLAALAVGKPEHAVLDVFANEPLPSDSAFWRHPRVTMTPHASGISNGNPARNEALFFDNLGRFLKGEPLLNVATAADVLAGQG